MSKKAKGTCVHVTAKVLQKRGSRPKLNKAGQWEFSDAPEFLPRLSPEQLFLAGSFGGTYWRPIFSGVLGKNLEDQHVGFEWATRVPARLVTQRNYDASKNKYGVKSGGDLEMWESKGWLSNLDPYGWVQWYCNFFEGRRTTDDERQLGRWKRCAGPTGRWRNNLITKVVRAGATFDDPSVSPVVRQTLLHWAYELNEADFEARRKELQAK